MWDTGSWSAESWGFATVGRIFTDVLGELVELTRDPSHSAHRARRRPGRRRAEVHRAKRVPARPPPDRHRGARAGTGRRRAGRPRYTTGSATGCCAPPTAGPAGPTPRCRSATRTGRWPRRRRGRALVRRPRPTAGSTPRCRSPRRSARNWTRRRLGRAGRPSWCRPRRWPARWPPPRRSGAACPPVELTAAPVGDWLAVAAARKGRPAGRRPARAHRRGPGPLRPRVRRRHAPRHRPRHGRPATAAGSGFA